VNIDHVATLRNARYRTMLDAANCEPSLSAAAHEVEAAGADSITIHLRQDRRHVHDQDVWEEILKIAKRVLPDFVCLVPENRQEVTTEGGLDVAGSDPSLQRTIDTLRGAGIRVSLFIDPDERQVDAALKTGAEMIEIHTGAYANADPIGGDEELRHLVAAAKQAHAGGLQVNAGHGITMINLVKMFQIPHLAELNIGHHLVSRAVFLGLGSAVREMRAMMTGYDVAQGQISSGT
jgi:pyridoxine 5-phosphate synthase